MTLRKVVYRFYLLTPGWALTRTLRKGRKCQRCRATKWLQLHHVEYPFFNVWYRLFWLAIGLWIFHEAGLWAFAALLVIPDPVSEMKTLCRRCHERTHYYG